MSAWLATSWVALVVAVAWCRRPAPSRGRRLARPAATRSPSPVDLVEAIGRGARSRAGRAADPALDRRLGWSLVLAVALALVEPALVLAGPAIWLTSRWRAARLARAHADRVLDDSPEVVDLFLLAVDAGCNPRLSVEAVASWSSGPWGEALDEVTGRMAHGERLSAALEATVDGLGDVARPLAVALLDTEHYGVALAPTLERLSRELALERRRRAEERARRVPVQLLFPLVFCTLPAFILLTVVPLLAGTLPALSP